MYQPSRFKQNPYKNENFCSGSRLRPEGAGEYNTPNMRENLFLSAVYIEQERHQGHIFLRPKISRPR